MAIGSSFALFGSLIFPHCELVDLRRGQRNSHALCQRAPGALDGTADLRSAARVAGAAPTGIATSESSAGRLQAHGPRRGTLAAPTAQPTKKPSTSGKVFRSFFAAS